MTRSTSVVRRYALVAGMVLSAACGSGNSETPPASTGGDPARALRSADVAARLKTPPRVVVTAASIDRAFALPPARQWRGGVDRERPRGGSDVYATAGPAVVVVRTACCHGTGFFVSADGLIVTNHHVIREGLTHTPEGSVASVHLGVLGADGIMQLRPQESRALLLKSDPVNDLALLRLQGPEAAATPFLKLAAAAPRPGQDCAILGHPVSGMLWTFRSCQIASVGDFPKDMMHTVMTRLSAQGPDRTEIETMVAAMPPRRTLLTSALSNPGDSGGPVLDRDAAVVGVTWGAPGNRDEEKFSYHVHFDALRRFLADVPSAAMLLVPDPWDFDLQVWAVDIDGDSKHDALFAGRLGNPEIVLLDLDNDSPAVVSGDQLDQIVVDRKWDFEFGYDLRGSGFTGFYDADNDGRMDTVLVTDDDSPVAKGRFRLADQKWRYDALTDRLPIATGTLFKDRRLTQRFDALWGALTTPR